jgi:hypothetical protein
MARSTTAGVATDAVSEIASLVPPNRSTMSWWERVPPEIATILPSVLQAYRDGAFGQARRPAAKAISAWLNKRGFSIGVQGVDAWLTRSERQ